MNICVACGKDIGFDVSHNCIIEKESIIGKLNLENTTLKAEVGELKDKYVKALDDCTVVQHKLQKAIEGLEALSKMIDEIIEPEDQDLEYLDNKINKTLNEIKGESDGS